MIDDNTYPQCMIISRALHDIEVELAKKGKDLPKYADRFWVKLTLMIEDYHDQMQDNK